MKTKSFRQSKNIMAYASLPHEADTRDLLQKALVFKKNIFLPAVSRNGGALRIFRVTHLKRDLAPGSYGVLEPRAGKCRAGRASELELIIVPGLGFDRSGGRLGHGKGYFDKFLKKAKRAKKIGIAFREQLLEKVPREKHDQCVDRVITD